MIAPVHEDGRYLTTSAHASLDAGKFASSDGGANIRWAPIMADSHTSSTAGWKRWQVTVGEAGEDPLCLALANTRNWRRAAAPSELLGAYGDLIDWIAKRQLLDDGGIEMLAAHAGRHARAATRELADTIRLREAIFDVFSAIANGSAAAATDIAPLVAAFNDAVGRIVMLPEDGRLRLRPRHDEPMLDIARIHVSVSAIALLTSERVRNVRECADQRGCGWLFVDTTRNGSRRYCFSNECGNRARQLAFRERRRSALQ